MQGNTPFCIEFNMKKFRNYILLFILIILIIVFSFNSNTVFESVKNSLLLCSQSVIPSLFPFFVLSEILITILSSTSLNPTVYCFICGLFGGFPTGTKNVCSMYQNKTLTKKQATALLYCTANASPAYIISFIGICMLKSRALGIILFFAQIISALICAITFGALSREKAVSIKTINVAELACSGISNAVTSCIYVCGYIVFMGIFADLLTASGLLEYMFNFLKLNNTGTISAIIVGSIEITRGIELIDFQSNNSIIPIAILLGFSGISVILQCISNTAKSSLPSFPIILNKLIYAIIMPFLVHILTNIFPISFNDYRAIPRSLIFLVLILFLGGFLYIIFDKYFSRLYNREKRKSVK